jgi:hypothetical protein
MRSRLGNSGSGVNAPIVNFTLDRLLAEYDALPPAYRRLVANAPYNIAVDRLTTVSLAALRTTLDRVTRQSVLDTYGPDHPQAR